MQDDSSDFEGPTRRDYIKYGGALVGSGLLAGCIDGDDFQSTTTETDSTPTTTRTTDTSTETPTEDGSYSVSTVPVGEVSFESVPETWVAENASWGDMGVALGLEKPSAVVLTGEYRTWAYEDIPSLSTDKEDMTSLWQDGISKETFLDIDAGVHFIDPNYMINLIPNWKRADVTEMADRVSPFCGNTNFSTYPWHEDYPYYSLYEATEKVAQVFQRMDRFEALQRLHNETISGIQERLPPESDRPDIALLSPASAEPKKYYPYRLGDTTAYKHWHDLGVSDAFEDSNIQSFTSDRGTIDYETLVEIDPEIMMFYTDKYWTRSEFRETYLSFLQGHNVANQLSAVKNGEVYRAGGMYQGPIINLAKTERAAKQLFSDIFDQDERLYSRQRIADIRNGDI
ncbi:ABC transporter substrate-binding protein [Halovenus rubra]|uniref:ABC transporter substrate-binding protein n=2 Tax=Halovenus rubra TaxID=869890 RepID=A0ACC7E380_9EURY|nr:ABC transporter substrate-binding protein [Halovenus rubra]